MELSILLKDAPKKHFKYLRPDGVESGLVYLCRDLEIIGSWKFTNLRIKKSCVSAANRVAMNSPKKEGTTYQVVLLYGVNV